MMTQDDKKRRVAKAALNYIEDDCIVGVGSGTTAVFFVAALATIKHRIAGAVASSIATAAQLKKYDIPVIPLNSTGDIPIYIDSADESTRHRCLVKGGGGALTQEKVIAAASKRFICIIDDSKYTGLLGRFPLPVEVIPMARSYVGRQLAKLGGQPMLREEYVTENGNLIIDLHNLKIMQPSELEQTINGIAGVVSNGLFAQRPADILLVADEEGIKTI